MYRALVGCICTSILYVELVTGLVSWWLIGINPTFVLLGCIFPSFTEDLHFDERLSPHLQSHDMLENERFGIGSWCWHWWIRLTSGLLSYLWDSDGACSLKEVENDHYVTNEIQQDNFKFRLCTIAFMFVNWSSG